MFISIRDILYNLWYYLFSLLIFVLGIISILFCANVTILIDLLSSLFKRRT